MTILILSGAAIVSLIIGVALKKKRDDFGYLEGIAIVLVVLVVTLVQASIDWNKEQKFRQLNSVKDNYEVEVKRGGKNLGIKVEELCVGDLVKVKSGDKLAGDCVVVEGSGLKCNESAMTGEVIDVSKEVGGDCFLLSGTVVSEGVGHALVVAVGEKSQWGLILAGLVVEPEDTPLQNRLDRLAWKIGKIGIFMAVLTFAVLMIRWIADSARSSNWEPEKILEFFVDSVTIVVVAIPEGLPLAITLGLAFAMRKMMKDNNLVRRLEACETMGSATQLNADKTGTLTQNRMTVVEAYLAGEKFDFEHDQAQDEKLSREFKELFATSIAVNSQANLEIREDGAVEHLGSKTECALLQLCQNWGFDYVQLRHEHPTTRIWLFNSAKKRMSSTSNVPGRTGASRLHTKGAPEIVLTLCTRALNADGTTIAPIDEAMRKDIMARLDEMAGKGLRTLLLCYRDVDVDITDESYWGKDAPESDLIYMGVVGIKDPVRPETKEAVKLLKGAGVTVRMVTGDNAMTAKCIAKEAGILDEDGLVLEGPKFRKMSSDELQKICTKIQVLARSTPTDKLKLVRAHKQHGEVVSVTGDGTNDAPALKEADVGFALGIEGTEIAKEACDIVILDDNIQSMAKAVKWGRNVYESIRKFLQFQLVVNIVAVSLNFISACAGRKLPLETVPLLWINCIMDSMGALALATEPPRKDLMKRKPCGRRAPLINRGMWRNILGVSIYQLIVCLVLQYAGKNILNIDEELELNSVIFNAFVFMQVFSEINSRRIVDKNIFQDIHKSFYFMGIIIITIGVQAALMFGVGGTTVGKSIGIDEINGVGWGVSIGLGALVLPIGLLTRLWPLAWCFGPTDEDPTERSKIEKLLHLPKRRPYVPPVDDEFVDGMTPTDLASKDEDAPAVNGAAVNGTVVDGMDVEAEQMPDRPVSPAVRLRVFVHAVAFINSVQRNAIARQAAQAALIRSRSNSVERRRSSVDSSTGK